MECFALFSNMCNCTISTCGSPKGTAPPNEQEDEASSTSSPKWTLPQTGAPLNEQEDEAPLLFHWLPYINAPLNERSPKRALPEMNIWKIPLENRRFRNQNMNKIGQKNFSG